MPRHRPALDLSNPQHAFAIRLQQLHRHAHKPQQKFLASVLLCSPSRVSDFLTGRAFPDWIYVERFVQHCGGDLDEFHKLWESTDEQIEALQRSTTSSPRTLVSGREIPLAGAHEVAPTKEAKEVWATPFASVTAETLPEGLNPPTADRLVREGRLPSPIRSRIVLIGAGSFSSHELQSLPSVAANIEGMAQVFMNQQICGIAPSNVSAVCDPASLMEFGAPIIDAAETAQELLLLYYSGHGLVASGGELYLAMAATQPSSERMHWSAVPFRLIRETLRNSVARNRVVVLDCCFSGRAVEALSDADTVIHGQTDIEGTFTLASSGRNMLSLAPRGSRYTAFTGELIELLTKGVPGGPEYLSLGEISRQLVRIMRAKGMPSPQTHGTNTAHELDLVRNRAWLPS